MSSQENSHIWILAEASQGRVTSETYEVAAFSRRVSREQGGRPSIVILGDPVEHMARELVEQTGFDAWGIQVPGSGDYNSDIYRSVLKSFFLQHKPRTLFMPHSSMGWDLAPALSVDLGASCLSGVLGFKSKDRLVFTRPICNGKILEDVSHDGDRPAVVTVLPGSDRPELTRALKPGAVRLSETKPSIPRTRILRTLVASPGSANLRDAEVIFAAGRGMESAENLEILFELAGLFQKAAVGALRPVCDMGWLPMEHQVGMTGQSVSPKLYIACGISGAVQHTMGITHADLIVVINKDRKALFCRQAHACVDADLKEFLPVLVHSIRRFRGEETDL